jgi:D-tagatose-1,6-bisphosphate aldolase subunit GatZ/KbaZ
MMHPLKSLLAHRKTEDLQGIPSICSAHPDVLAAAFEFYKELDLPLLIEATANQVNQYGGYTGLNPQAFYDQMIEMAKAHDFPLDRLILGGDHLGPLVWAHEGEEGMKKAEVLIHDFVLAGFTKIHLDTSMKLLGDTELKDETIASRGIRLMKVAEEAYQERLKNHPNALAPVYIIGSEVPIPGGALEHEVLQVTSEDALKKTLNTYQKILEEAGLSSVSDRIVGIVVQPGVEFSDDVIEEYQRDQARSLCDALNLYPNFVFEGHSTDYQTPHALKEMVEDGIAILKVGPELTFAYREGLFALEAMEKELGIDEASQFSQKLEEVMLRKPETWQKHYHGTEREKAIKRKYSYSDRSRYVMNDPVLVSAKEQLLKNTQELPMPIISQWMHEAYQMMRNEQLTLDSKALSRFYLNQAMPNLVLVRVDQRLIHGQVLTQWLKSSQANLIVVANDAVSLDPLRQSLMNVAIPNGIQSRYFSLDKTIEIIHKAADHQKILLLIASVDDAYHLIQKGVPIVSLNIGNVHLENDRVSINDYVALNFHEQDLLQKLIQQGIEVYYQRVPSEEKKSYTP